MVRSASAPAASPSVAAAHGVRTWLAAVIIVGAVLLAYANTRRVPFFFDDRAAIVENATIREWSTALFPPTDSGLGVRGRPLINLSLAANYALGGLDVRGYHAANLAFHAGAALLLFGIVRRTLRGARWRDQFGTDADGLALAASLVWAVHPLLTESVTCVIQRTESLSSLFYLFTLYGFVRAAEPSAPRWWYGISVAACAVGVMAKEILATAPVLVLLYDAICVSDGFAAAWRARRGYYLALMGTWAPLALLIVGAQGRGGTVGFDVGMSAWKYALTQCWAVVHYLRLAIVSWPLVVDYGVDVVTSPAAVWPQALLLSVLVGASAVAVVRRSAAGFLGAWFFVILGPSSSVLPLTTQTIAEHRMYLPLAAVVVLAVFGVYRWLGRGALVGFGGVAVALGIATFLRNEDYRSEIAIWTQTVAHRPGNPRAHYNLAVALLAENRVAEAEPELRTAVRLSPGYTDAHVSLGQLLVNLQRPAEAVVELEAALQLRSNSFPAHVNLGTALVATGRAAEALPHYQEAVRLQPTSALAQFGLGSTLAGLGRLREAIALLTEAVRLDPQNAAAQLNLGGALATLGDPQAALPHFEAAVQLRPQAPEVHFNFGLLLAQLGQVDRAVAEFQRTLELRPDFAPARASLDQLRPYLRK